MNIGVLWNSRTSGGGQVFLQNLVTSLAEEPGCSSVTVFLTGPSFDSELPAGVEVCLVSHPSARVIDRLLAARRVRGMLRLHPVDVLLCPGTSVVRRPGVLTVMWPLTVAPFEPDALRVLAPSPIRRVRWTVLRRTIIAACLRADALVFSSDYARVLHLDAIVGLEKRPSAVIAPAASLERQRTQGTPVGSITDSNDNAWSYLLFVSHLYPYKMVVEMIEAFALSTADLRITNHLQIAGASVSTVYYDKILSTIARLRLTDRVHLLGTVDQAGLEQLYRNAQAFIFPSISENAGSYALIDAFTYGLPVACSSRSSMPEVCDGAAKMFDPFDIASFAGALSDMSSDPAAVASLAAASRKRGNDTPTWADTARAFVDFAGGLLSGFGKPHQQGDASSLSD